jgi:hypothetical protein
VFNGYSDDQAELLVPGSWIASTDGGTSTAVESPAGTLTIIGDGTNQAQCDQSFTTTPGETYLLKFTVDVSTISARIGETQGSLSILSGIYSSGINVVPFVATSAIAWVRFRRSTVGTRVITNISCKLVPASRITTGCKYDGSDDNHLTPYKASSGPNFIVAYVNVPTSIPAAQVIVGAQNGASERFIVVIDTLGRLAAGVGAQAPAAIFSSSDLRGKTVVVALTCDGSTVKLFEDGAEVYSGAQSGTPTAVYPFRVGGTNNAGSAGSFFAGTIKNVIAGTEYLNLARYLQIRNDLINQ